MRSVFWRIGLILIILVVATTGLVFPPQTAQAEDTQTAEDIKYVAPRLSSDAPAYDEAHPENLTANQLYAKSAILIEASTGEVIFEKNADEIMFPASTTKILTTLLGVELGNMDATVTLDAVSADVPSDSSSIPLSVGETINFQDLLYATMVRSGNEGANLIAQTIAGSVSGFVDLMNQAAANLGCTNTHFMNPNGLHDDNHYTTARDMSKIARVAMQNETFRNIAKTYSYRLPKSNLQRSRVLIGASENWLNASEENEFRYSYANGIKTGYHSRAGYCYIGSAERDGVTLISVVLYTSKDGRWIDSKKMMEYGFSQFVSVSPIDLYDMNPTIIETSGFSMEDSNIGRLQLDIRASESARGFNIVATKAEVETMARDLKDTVVINYTRTNFAAPVTQGELFGTMTFYPPDGGSSITYDLIASRSVERRANAPLSIEEIEAATYADPNPLPPLSVEMALFLLLPFALLFGIIRLLMRLFRKGGGKSSGKRSRIPKPSNRYFR